MAKILLVDDSWQTRDAIAMVFADAGHEVLACGGLAPALRQIKAQRFDGVITDLHFPGVRSPESGGRELLENLAALPAPERPKILIVSVSQSLVTQAARDFAGLNPQYCQKRHCMTHVNFV